jgi:hypothetical protein
VSAQHGVDRLQPFLSFYGIEIFELGRVGHEIGSSLAASALSAGLIADARR